MLAKTVARAVAHAQDRSGSIADVQRAVGRERDAARRRRDRWRTIVDASVGVDAVHAAVEPARHVQPARRDRRPATSGWRGPTTNGSRVPSGRTMKIDTGACWPREPLKVTYRLPSRVEDRAVDLVQAGRQRRADLDVGRLAGRARRCAPACARRRARPARSTVSACGDAIASRAGTPPIGHVRQRRDRPRSPSPAMVTRPPSTAQSGRTAEMRGRAGTMAS